MTETPQPPADYHIHTSYCGHAEGKTVDYVEHALAAGLNHIGFSDHLGRYYLTKTQLRRYWNWGMNPKNLPRYLSELAGLREAYADRIDIRVGLEIDFVEGATHLLEPILELYDFDYLLGSIHCLPSLGWRHLSDYVRRDPWPLYREYFRVASSALHSEWLDCLAHPDFIWRYVKWPAIHTDRILELIEDTCRTAGQCGKAVEINANAFLWSELYRIDGRDPFRHLLSCIRKYDLDYTVGSDAHRPGHVGKAFDGLRDILCSHGLNRYTVFRNRTKKKIAFS